MNPEDFVRSVVMDLHSTAPPEILAMVSGNLQLMQGVQALAEDAIEGLRAIEKGEGDAAGLTARIESRKGEILRAAPQGHPTLEGLLSSFRDKVVAEGRRIAGG